jgi:hypothetical protein
MSAIPVFYDIYLGATRILLCPNPDDQADLGLGGDCWASVNYQRAPNDAPTLDVPVNCSFYRRYKDRREVSIGIHVPPGGLMRLVIDDDPPERPWRWPLVILITAAAVAMIVRYALNALPPR